MKKTIGLLAICGTAAMLSLQAFANSAPLQPEATIQDQCTPESKTAWYTEFTKDLKTDQAKAYELAKKYLACPSAAGEEQITSYLKNFVTKYEKASRKDQVYDLVYNKKDYAKAFELGKQIIAEEPDNLRVLIDLSNAGYASRKVETYNADTLAYAQKAIQLIESGKTLENWTPYTSKDEALGYLYYTVGLLNAQKNPAGGLTSVIKAAQFDGGIKKLASTYAFIAGAYEAGQYAKLSADYKTKFEGKDESPESKLALENINQVVDRMVDAYARAVALAGNDPQKAVWMESLTTWYKFRHNQSDAGLTEMIASVMSKPLPPEPTPITTLPAAAPTTNPASGSMNSSGSNPAAGSVSAPSVANKPGGTSAASTSAPPTTTTQPGKGTAPANSTPTKSTKPSGTKPRPRRNHRH